MTAHFGEGLADLPRQFAMFVDDDPRLATAFLRSYLGDSVDVATRQRLSLYLLDERMIVWDFFHQPDRLHLWNGGDVGFRDWYRHYGDALALALA
jgi:hypothetical protein